MIFKDTYGHSYDNAVKYCNELNYAGYSDWRLPSINELLSITVDSKYSEGDTFGYDVFIANAFKYVKNNLTNFTKTWSSTRYASERGRFMDSGFKKRSS